MLTGLSVTGFICAGAAAVQNSTANMAMAAPTRAAGPTSAWRKRLPEEFLRLLATSFLVVIQVAVLVRLAGSFAPGESFGRGEEPDHCVKTDPHHVDEVPVIRKHLDLGGTAVPTEADP